MHIVSLVARYFLCLVPYIILVSNKDIIYHITGPITVPPFGQERQSLIYYIGAIQFFRVFYKPIANSFIFLLTQLSLLPSQHPMSSLVNNMTIKHLLVIVMKLWVIFYQIHRLKYYLHVFFIELFIVMVNVLADVVNNSKVSLVMDIVLVDALNRVALFYQLTRTFNPNFGLYFFGNNLLTLICYMLETDKKQVLYVRHDIYRIMIVTFVYLFLLSLFQSSVTYRPLVIFLLTAFFFLKAIQSFSNHSILEMKNGHNNRQKPKLASQGSTINNFRRNNNYYYRTLHSYQSLKSYIRQMKHNQTFLYFIILVTITIGIELIFIQKDTNDMYKQALIGDQQTVRNSFIEFYTAIKQNASQSINQ